jgi:NADH-quinone oxidoreductase subunit A
MTDLVFYLLVFLAVGTFFLFIHLLVGKFIRPARPEPEKLTIYECGEPTVGSAWIQFDLRYYVVALLFVVFDVEVAFFFPWAVVFGNLNRLAKDQYPAHLEPDKARAAIVAELTPTNVFGTEKELAAAKKISSETAQSWAWVAFIDILVFFGVLMVGFAYLWRRGDIDWVRTVERQVAPTAEELPPTDQREEEFLAGARRNGQSAPPVAVVKHS